MIPRWQMVGIMMLLLFSLAIGIIVFPHGWAHAYLTGQCAKPRPPSECTYHPGGGRSLRGFH